VNGDAGYPGPAETDGCCGSSGADGDGAAEDGVVITERLFPIPIGAGAKAVTSVGEVSSPFFLRPPKTRLNLVPAPPEDTGTVGDGGGTESSDGNLDGTWPIVGKRDEERGTGRMVSGGR
jgi:hypothetical protein